MEITTAVRRHARTFDAIKGYVDNRIYRHELFHDPDDAFIDSGRRAIVIKNLGGWTSPNFNTAEFPLVEIQCWADHSRNNDGEIVKADAIDNAWAVEHVVNEIFHGVRDEVWGESGSSEGLKIITCYRYREAIPMTKDNTKDLPGDLVYVSAAYAVTLVQGSIPE